MCLRVKKKWIWGILHIKSKCLIKIQWVLEIVSKTKMSSRLTNSAYVTVTTGCHSGIQLPLTSPHFFWRFSGQVVSTMCSRMSLHLGFSSDPPWSSLSHSCPLRTLFLWASCPQPCAVTWSLRQPRQWPDLTELRRKTAIGFNHLYLKINPLGQVSMDGGVELVVVTKQMLCHFSPRSLCSHFHWFLYSEFPLSTLGRDVLLSQSLLTESNHARSYLESRVSLTSHPDFNTANTIPPRPAVCYIYFIRNHFFRIDIHLSIDTEIDKIERYVKIYIWYINIRFKVLWPSVFGIHCIECGWICCGSFNIIICLVNLQGSIIIVLFPPLTETRNLISWRNLWSRFIPNLFVLGAVFLFVLGVLLVENPSTEL